MLPVTVDDVVRSVLMSVFAGAMEVSDSDVGELLRVDEVVLLVEAKDVARFVLPSVCAGAVEDCDTDVRLPLGVLVLVDNVMLLVAEDVASFVVKLVCTRVVVGGDEYVTASLGIFVGLVDTSEEETVESVAISDGSSVSVMSVVSGWSLNSVVPRVVG